MDVAFDKFYHRQWDVLKPTHDRLIVIGAGGIGSLFVVMAAKMGCENIEVWDDDKVEEHNLSNQYYPLKALGEFKVDALKKEVEAYSKAKIVVVRRKITETDHPAGVNNNTIVVSATDSFHARKLAFGFAKHKAKIVIDGRMSFDSGTVYCINPRKKEDVEFYEPTLLREEDGYQGRCTAQAVIYNIGVVAGFMCNKIKKVLNEESYDREVAFALSPHVATVNRI